MKKMFTLSLLAAALILSGCSKDETSTSSSSSNAASSESSNSALLPGQNYPSENDGLIQRRAKPASEYPTLVDMNARYYEFDATHRAYADLFFSATERNDLDATIALLLDPNFNQITDTFARKDKIAELAPMIEAYKKEVRAKSKNVTVELNIQYEVYPYDETRGGFPMNAFFNAAGSNTEWRKLTSYGTFPPTFSAVVLGSYSNQQNELNHKGHVYKTDEQNARKLEAYLSTLRNNSAQAVAMKTRAFGYVLGTFHQENKYETYIMPEGYELYSEKDPSISIKISHKDLASKYRLSPYNVNGFFTSDFLATLNEKN